MHWSDNTSGSYDDFSNGGGGIRNYNIYVQDKYKPDSIIGYLTVAEKLALFESTWSEKRPDELLLNFGSCVVNKFFPKASYIYTPLLYNLGQSSSADRAKIVGVSFFDYAAYTYDLNPKSDMPEKIDCVALTIDSNFDYDTYSETYSLRIIKEDL